MHIFGKKILRIIFLRKRKKNNQLIELIKVQKLTTLK